jgi:hypothetical protein
VEQVLHSLVREQQLGSNAVDETLFHGGTPLSNKTAVYMAGAWMRGHMLETVLHAVLAGSVLSGILVSDTYAGVLGWLALYLKPSFPLCQPMATHQQAGRCIYAAGCWDA